MAEQAGRYVQTSGAGDVQAEGAADVVDVDSLQVRSFLEMFPRPVQLHPRFLGVAAGDQPGTKALEDPQHGDGVISEGDQLRPAGLGPGQAPDPRVQVHVLPPCP